ncbi:hypothetical protein ACIRJO_41060 [Streptomyces sp. NPDC102394]|uniref:hypothetical protein n=1 Tax=Streptomyces sp. NPDC102394 TaxID=3366167 RepID=UPI00380E41D0
MTADVLDEWTTRFIAQFALPTAQRLTLHNGRHNTDVLIDTTTGSFATLHKEDGRWIVRQEGPGMLWDAVEDQLNRWYAVGTPAAGSATIRVTPAGQSIHW